MPCNCSSGLDYWLRMQRVRVTYLHIALRKAVVRKRGFDVIGASRASNSFHSGREHRRPASRHQA
jgi:hypothetical protein